ncbi:MAG: hypothetical protein HYY30_12830 [Chloroflexi bacterium]|nr:hypothetical protein [Chloroflexota bacterium]
MVALQPSADAQKQSAQLMAKASGARAEICRKLWYRLRGLAHPLQMRSGARDKRPSVVYSCIVDRHPRFAYSAVLWAASLISYAGQEPGGILVQLVEGCDPSYRRAIESLGVRTEYVKAFDSRHPLANRLRLLESEALRVPDYVVLCDCDLAFCSSIAPWVAGDTVRAKIVDCANLSLEHWRRLFAAAGFAPPSTTTTGTVDRCVTLPDYCNGGLMILPRALVPRLADVWPKWDRWLLDRPELVHPFEFHTYQVAFTLSCRELGLTIDHLPSELNCPTHLSPSAVDESLEAPPLVLHYHSRLDTDGLLLPMGLPLVDPQIAKINQLVRTTPVLRQVLVSEAGV